MNRRAPLWLLLCLFFQSCPATAVPPAKIASSADANGLDAQFQSAVALYHSGRFADAASQLEKLLPQVPKSFEVYELLGLSYAGAAEDQKAVAPLQMAVRLKPESAAARTNLATCLLHTGNAALAEVQFRKALALEPHDYDANHNLAEFYLQSKQMPAAIPLLEAAQQINPSAYNNGYDLALSYFLSDRLEDAKRLLQGMVLLKNTGELHNLLGQIAEKQGQFLEAAEQFKVAANMDPSEDNLFVWGSELLLHRTYEPAIDVFKKAVQRYPTSPRLFIGLGMSLYARGMYEESIKSLLAAADLNPTDARCYLFLSKAYLSSPNQADDVIERFRRYAALEPGNGLAQYYYAVSLWKGKRVEDPNVNYAAIEALLRKAIALDGKLADAHLQLGIVYADQHEYEQAFPEYQRALALNPEVPDVHYRLGQYYGHVGQKEKAQQEFGTYQKLQAQHQAAIDKERAEVQQFVYAAQGAHAAKH